MRQRVEFRGEGGLLREGAEPQLVWVVRGVQSEFERATETKLKLELVFGCQSQPE